MKVLWLCNSQLPMFSEAVGDRINNYGGWLTGSALELSSYDDVQLFILVPSNFASLEKVKINRIVFLGFDINNFEDCLERVISEVSPDIIHVHGSEHLPFVKAVSYLEKREAIDKLVVSIQGMPFFYSKHYYCGLPAKVIFGFTLRDFIKMSNIYLNKRRMAKAGALERKSLSAVHNVIGRTDWDYACVKSINPDTDYFHCNEILRPSFYEGKKWDFLYCEKHSIFVSQCSYPIKGFHFILEAFSVVVKKYPDANLYVTGEDLVGVSASQKIKQSYYQKYLARLITKYKLADKVHFLGSLSEHEMKNRYLLSNVFVSASSIENSPNSLGEAMILGVPCISSDVGGVRNMMTDKVDGLIYPYDESYVLAHYIEKLFNDDCFCAYLSKNAIAHATQTHNRHKNSACLKNIYSKIISNKK